MIAIKETRTNALTDQEMEIVIELEDGRCIVIWHHEDHDQNDDDDDGYRETDTIATYPGSFSYYDSCSLPPKPKKDKS